MNILVANIGSTSFKYRLLEAGSNSVLAEGRIERIGQAGGDCPDYATAIARCTAAIAEHELHAVGFKAVHAGPVSGAQLVDERVLEAMEEFAFFAPAHNPPYIAAMRSFREALPNTPLVALFETAFFERMDDVSTTYSVPWEWRTELGVRRYGFHGASHRAASERAIELMGGRREGLRHISCHLGGSSSMAAVYEGVAVDTSFGISPQSGLPHNNRTGDFDPFAVLFVMKKRGLSVDEMARFLGSESGLKGISGTSGDMRDLENAAAAGSHQARVGIGVFVREIRKYLGSFMVTLGGVDVITFSGGIGENSAFVREQVCANLTDFGITLSPAANAAARSEAQLSGPGAKVKLWVVPADEERTVARATAELVARAKGAN